MKKILIIGSFLIAFKIVKSQAVAVVKDPGMNFMFAKFATAEQQKNIKQIAHWGKTIAHYKKQIDIYLKYKKTTDSILTISANTYRYLKSFAKYSDLSWKDGLNYFEEESKISLNPYNYIGFRILKDRELAEDFYRYTGQRYDPKLMEKINLNFRYSNAAHKYTNIFKFTNKKVEEIESSQKKQLLVKQLTTDLNNMIKKYENNKRQDILKLYLNLLDRYLQKLGFEEQDYEALNNVLLNMFLRQKVKIPLSQKAYTIMKYEFPLFTKSSEKLNLDKLYHQKMKIYENLKAQIDGYKMVIDSNGNQRKVDLKDDEKPTMTQGERLMANLQYYQLREMATMNHNKKIEKITKEQNEITKSLEKVKNNIIERETRSRFISKYLFKFI